MKVRCAWFCAMLLAAAASPAAAGTPFRITDQGWDVSPQDPGGGLVSAGDSFTRDLNPKMSHLLGITLGPHEFLRLSVSSRGGKIAARVLDPTGAEIAADPFVCEDPTYLSLLTTASGQYVVRISSLETDSKVARFEVRIDERRLGIQSDRIRIAVEGNCRKAARLRREFTNESDRRAVDLLREAVRLSAGIGARELTARVLYNLGDLHLDRAHFPEALSCFDDSLRLSRDAGYRIGTARALAGIGYIQIQNGEGKRSLEPLSDSLKISREMNDLPATGLALAYMGEAHYWIGRQREAMSYYLEAVKLWRDAGDKRGLASTLYFLGSARSDLSEVQEAFHDFDESLGLWRDLGDRHGEGVTLIQLGSLYGKVGEKQEAISRFHQAEEIFRKGGDALGEAMLMDKFAYAYYSLGNLETALDFSRKALALYQRARFTEGEAAQLRKMGEIHHDRGESQTALEYFNKSISLYQKVQDRRQEGVLLYHIGKVQRGMGNLIPAIDSLSQALLLVRSAENLIIQSRSLNELGLAYGQIGKPEQAIGSFVEALELNQKARDGFGEVQTRLNLSRAYREHGNREEALAQIKDSIETIESLRTKVDLPSLRISYFSTIRRNYDLYLDLLMDSHRSRSSEGQDVLAFQVSERARARNLLELLEETRAGIRRGGPSPLTDRENELLRSLNAKAQLQTRIMSGKHSQDVTEKLAAEIRALENEHSRLLSEIKRQSPRYAELTQPQPLNLAEIRDLVLDEDTLLLEYSLGVEHSYLWAVSRTGLASFELPPGDLIERLAGEARNLLSARQEKRPGETASQFHQRALQADTHYWKCAGELSGILLGPVADMLNNRRLLVVPDGILQYLPFAALPAPSSRGSKNPGSVQQDRTVPLVAEHEIVSLPSASTLGVLRRQIQGRKPAERSVAVLADPVFQRDDPRLAGVASSSALRKSGPRSTLAAASIPGKGEPAVYPAPRDGSTFSRLPFSGREGNDIASTVQPGSATLWAGLEASRDRATSGDLAHFRIVHFATHGMIDDFHPNLSGIVLSMYDAKGREQDGFLRLHDIYNLNLPAELVVLSACNTGLGKEVRGEGFIGLVRGFMYAGAARVVSSLWRVDDQSTAELMKRFYRGMLKEGLSPAAALRVAQVEMSKHERWSAPYYWAGFVLQGEYK